MTTRWFVEVSPVDGDTLKERYCVEAPQWQQALQQTRKLRGDRGALSRCSMELLEGGYRATDPSIRVRYMITRAPADAPLTFGMPNGAAADTAAPAPLAQPAPAPTVPVPRSQPVVAPQLGAAAVAPISVPAEAQSSRAARGHSTSPAVPRPFRAPLDESNPPSASAPKAPPSESVPAPVAVVPAPVAAVTVAPAPVALVPAAVAVSEVTAPEPIPSLPGLTLISRRSEEPREGTPITYREYAFAVEPGLSPKDLERYARATWEQVRTALAARVSGKFVQIALFDHYWQGRPERPPVAVLAWKDWRGEPVIQVRGPAPPASVAAPPVPIAAPIVEPAPVAAPSVPIAASPAEPAAPVAAPKAPSERPAASFPDVAAPAFPPSSAPTAPEGTRVSVRPLAPFETARGRRGPSEDLISELFEEMHHLRFMPDIVTGAEYVMNVLGRVLPCEGVLVHVFDINTRQFVVVRAQGPTSEKALLYRTPDTFALFRETFRRARTLNFPDASSEEGFRDERWERLGVIPKAALCGAAQQGGRYLGVIELANPKGGEGFHDSEINAVDYICEQFADFVASRPIVLDDDAVIPRA